MFGFLKTIPLFSSLKDEEIEAIDRLSLTKKCTKDTIILLEDEEGDTLFVIMKGKVKVSTFSEGGKELIFTILGEGDFFGDMSLLDGRPRSATVISIEDTELKMIRRSDFHILIEKHPKIALRLLEALTLRLRRTDERLESLALLDVTGRIAGILLQLADEQGEKLNHSVIIKHRPTHQELANMVGTTRETVTRVLKQLENRNYITIDGKEIVINDTSAFKSDLYL
jgi:CRP/FNR family transcriptional regulator, cyclic AMP receptor protein